MMCEEPPGGFSAHGHPVPLAGVGSGEGVADPFWGVGLSGQGLAAHWVCLTPGPGPAGAHGCSDDTGLCSRSIRPLPAAPARRACPLGAAGSWEPGRRRASGCLAEGEGPHLGTPRSPAIPVTPRTALGAPGGSSWGGDVPSARPGAGGVPGAPREDRVLGDHDGFLCEAGAGLAHSGGACPVGPRFPGPPGPGPWGGGWGRDRSSRTHRVLSGDGFVLGAGVGTRGSHSTSWPRPHLHPLFPPERGPGLCPQEGSPLEACSVLACQSRTRVVPVDLEWAFPRPVLTPERRGGSLC